MNNDKTGFSHDNLGGIISIILQCISSLLLAIVMLNEVLALSKGSTERSQSIEV